MREFIKKFESAESADNYIIHKVPFLTTINGTQNLTCSETGMKIINNNGVSCTVSNHSTIVPIVPIWYIYCIWTIIDSGNNKLPYIVEKINNSRAHTKINGCVFLKYPNELLNFNIHNVYDFFESIDESGIHKNYIFNSPVYNDSSDLLDPDNFRFFTKFLGWHNLAITDLPAMTSDYKIYANTGMDGLGFVLQEQDEHGNFYYDFNTETMNFYTDINDCITDFSSYADVINNYYTALNTIYPVKFIFNLNTVFCFITDTYSYFVIIKNNN